MGLKVKIFVGLLAVYLLVVLIMYFLQRTFLYFPDVDNYLTEEKIQGAPDTVYIDSEKNIKLYSWFYFDNPAAKTVLFLHGNAGTLNSRIYKLNYFRDLGLNYLAISWRGFSGNEGEPTEKGLYEDAYSALTWLNQRGIDSDKIVIYGESLGTGIALEVSQNQDYAGLILESPYTSIIDMGKISFPYLPIKFILKDRFNSMEKTKNIKIPTLVMHGKQDSLVPFYMGQKVYDSLTTEKYSYFVEDDDHMMRFDSSMKNALSDFFNKLD